MNLEGQTQIQIQNKVFTLGSPVVHADTLDQLLYAFEQMGVTERPIVIINPVQDSLADLPNLLENYIENNMQGKLTQQRVSYLFQGFTDEQIEQWARSQYKLGGELSCDYLLETGRTIRKQSEVKQKLDSVNARCAELWQQHCLNPDSDAGSAEYSNLMYNVIPTLEAELKQITDYLGKIPKNLDNGTRWDIIVEEPTNSAEEPTPEVREVISGEMTGTGKPDIYLMSSSNLIMPLSMAKQLAVSPQNKVYLEQQSIEVPGYKTVPLEYLLALGITLYADGLPIVYTKSGSFRRIGNSSVSPVVNSYWYPKPRYH